MSPARIQSTINLWKTQLPNVKPFYAVKCNPEPVFLNHLFDNGINFDCASERELIEIRKLAFNTLTNRVIYANPCKSVRDLTAAKEIGSPITVVDSVEEVEKLNDQKYTGSALIRIAVDDSGSTMPFSSKFGAQFGSVGAIAEAAYKNSIAIRGISFHVGSGCKNGLMFSRAIQEAYSLFPTLWKNLHNATILDIGGGFLPNECDFRKKALYIRGTTSNIDSANIELWAEPGRFFAANSFDFYVQVIGKKRSASMARMLYTIDDSLYGQFTNILFDHAKPLWTRISRPNERSRSRVAGTLFGRTCDSLDVIAKSDCMEELEVGDWLCFPNMGAYTRATASEFNGFPRPEVFVLEPHQRFPCPFQLFPESVPRHVKYIKAIETDLK